MLDTAASPARSLRRLAAAALALAALAFAPAAHAQAWNEVGDAGDLVSSAQVTAGTGALSTLNGFLAFDADVDLYCVHLNATPPVGLPLLWMNCVTINGPQVWLFDAAGNGVATNMLCAGGQKLIVAPNVSLPAGNYYVAVAYSGIEPQSAGGAIWIPNVLAQHSPDGPGAPGPLTGWAGAAIVQPSNPYSLGFYGSWWSYCDAATPASRPSWGSLKIHYGN